MTARSSAGPSRASTAKAVRSSAIRPASNALWTSGRARVTRATTPAGPVRSTRRLPVDIALTAASYGRDPIVSRGRRRGPRRVGRCSAGRHGPGCRTSARPRAPTPRRCRSPPPTPTASAPRSARAGNRARARPEGPTPSSASPTPSVMNNEAAATIRPSASPAMSVQSGVRPTWAAIDRHSAATSGIGALATITASIQASISSSATTRMARSGDPSATTSSGAAT